MARIKFENEGLVSMFDELSKKVPAKIPKALEEMADYLTPKLRAVAPYDGSKRHKDEHLRDIIKRTNVRQSSKSGQTSKHVTIFVSPRGIKGAKKGKHAAKNWDADKHIFKLVVSEFGSSKQPAKPFWKPTVSKEETNVINKGIEVLLSEVDEIVNK